MQTHIRKELFLKLFSTAKPPNERKNNSIDGVFHFFWTEILSESYFYDINEYLN